MIGEPRSLRRVWELFQDPATPENRALMAARWAGLDPALRLPGQGLGQKATGCGATIGVQPRCDFACTGCYLGHEANRVPALPTAAVLRQLDELRRWLGPKSNVQITDGEVTLRPVEELIAILRYARSIGVIPMVMTHGDAFRRRPGLLERLMTEGGLTEVSIHVDITQRGRDGYQAPRSELELTPLREEFAALVREARRRTGRPLRAAMTLTVTQENLPQISGVVRWLVRNRDAFSLASFQPLAQVGRTRRNQRGVTATDLWREVGSGTETFGVPLDDTGPMHFGHTDCTRFVSLVALQRGEEVPRLFRAIRNEPEDLAVMREFFARGLGGVAFRDDDPLVKTARFFGMVRTAPGWMLGRARRWIDARSHAEAVSSLSRLLCDGWRGMLRVDTLSLTSHHNMSASIFRTPLAQEFLAACAFRLPYQGRMVPMCEMNADGVRERFYGEIAEGRGLGVGE